MKNYKEVLYGASVPSQYVDRKPIFINGVENTLMRCISSAMEHQTDLQIDLRAMILGETTYQSVEKIVVQPDPSQKEALIENMLSILKRTLGKDFQGQIRILFSPLDGTQVTDRPWRYGTFCRNLTRK